MLNQYNFSQRIIHKLILSSKNILKSLYEFEKLINSKDLNIEELKNNNHIFITGLPRSGTTALLNAFYNSNKYASLTYGDMPMITSPNINSKIFKSFNENYIQRIHADNIYINKQSPESFDEIFLNAFDENYNEYLNYIGMILKKYNKQLYLSKNNLTYKRKTKLKKILPCASFVITVRHPFYHASSLYHQHLKITEKQKQNHFIIDYMNLTHHNEFGIGHKPWSKPKKYLEINKPNYWLEQWFEFYKNIFINVNKNDIVVIYELLENKKYLLNKFHKIQNLNKYIFINNNKNKIYDFKYDNNLLNRCLELYSKFIKIY